MSCFHVITPHPKLTGFVRLSDLIPGIFGWPSSRETRDYLIHMLALHGFGYVISTVDYGFFDFLFDETIEFDNVGRWTAIGHATSIDDKYFVAFADVSSAIKFKMITS